ncbi:replicative helicase loader/inhibitor [Bacillus paranthracis]|uniref:replicative helicase loader/inhibitor n=1 Tax=Bacillus cereus group TaxID=86661 RepID=UPI001F5675D1
MDRKSVIKLFSLLTSSYDMFEVTSEKVELWSKMLEDQDARLVFEKAAHHIKTEQYPPSISQLREQKREHVANVGYLDNQVVFKIESMREGALKEVPHDKAPEFIKRMRDQRGDQKNGDSIELP